MSKQKKRLEKEKRRERARRVEKQRRIDADVCAELMFRSERARDAGDLEGSRRLLEKALNIRPNHAESLKRRRERDLRRMADYYQAIDEEIRRKIARAAAKEDVRKSEIQRLEGTARAYQARAAELLERYRMRVRVTGIATLACWIPTYRLRVLLLRRTRNAEASFSWNPFDRKIESRCCDSCGQATGAAALCDDRVHYLCLDCLGPCPTCSKPFCRACHARCPRSHG